jgi:hypothetical protein
MLPAFELLEGPTLLRKWKSGLGDYRCLVRRSNLNDLALDQVFVVDVERLDGRS